MIVRLGVEWNVGPRIGSGGFGEVYEASSPDHPKAAAKFVPKGPGAERELLFVGLDGVPNVMPVIDSGETDTDWVIVMPLADASLRQRLDQVAGALPANDVLAVLGDVVAALSALDGRVVHRDLKPENVLLLEGRWCLADFGISRYAEASTAAETRKFAMSPPYAAPERWRAERATGAADVYSLGVMVHEMLTGVLPFPGPSLHEFRDQHLHREAPEASGCPTAIATLVAECLFKAANARPAPAAIAARLQRMERAATSGGLARLQAANQAEVARQGAAAAHASREASGVQTRKDLAAAARQTHGWLGDALRVAIVEAAPAARVAPGRERAWSIRLGQATLAFSSLVETSSKPWGNWSAPAFDVVASASLEVSFPPDNHDYAGRGHSLWFCDAQEAGRYGWFETAFMLSPFARHRSTTNPFALPPGVESAKALWTGLAEFQVAWPFEPLTADDIEEMVDRWAGWFAQAGQGHLSHPSTMPERQPMNSWRPQ